ncbi:hypothetical protein O0L34_g4476 [Tuta absoluta]|nr:hypothetical protein O0L34_g4476 [Tuta absoluta]
MDRFNMFHFVLLISTSLCIAWSFCSGDESFIYPLPDPIIPEECLSKDYCEHVPNYPEELAAKLVATLPNLDHRKQNQSPVKMEPCKYTKRNVTPKAAKDTTGKWHYILNPKDNPIQWYLEKKCITNRTDHHGLQRCDNTLFFDNLLGRCQQRTNTVVYKTIDRFKQVRETGNFLVYCCCVCNGYKEQN